MALVADVDDHDAEGNKVVLMTLHAAKGLEFSVVFIAGMDDGLLPHQRALDSYDNNAREEERRLFNVGLTRARKVLYLSRANFRFTNGSGKFHVPSRFLRELPPNLVRSISYIRGREIKD